MITLMVDHGWLITNEDFWRMFFRLATYAQMNSQYLTLNMLCLCLPQWHTVIGWWILFVETRFKIVLEKYVKRLSKHYLKVKISYFQHMLLLTCCLLYKVDGHFRSPTFLDSQILWQQSLVTIYTTSTVSTTMISKAMTYSIH